MTLQVKSEYVHHKTIMGAIGVKLCATGIEKAVAGTPIMVVGPDDDEEDIKEEVLLSEACDTESRVIRTCRFLLCPLCGSVKHVACSRAQTMQHYNDLNFHLYVACAAERMCQNASGHA